MGLTSTFFTGASMRFSFVILDDAPSPTVFCSSLVSLFAFFMMKEKSLSSIVLCRFCFSSFSSLISLTSATSSLELLVLSKNVFFSTSSFFTRSSMIFRSAACLCSSSPSTEKKGYTKLIEEDVHNIFVLTLRARVTPFGVLKKPK